MRYVALYRKMRPKKFAQMVGQAHIVKTLVNQIKSDRISHAYLFCGTRGTGKTSAAKIFAKAVNCVNSKDGEPCGECESCRRIESGGDMNVIEIDAASNNSVDNIREIRDEVKYPPANARFKVYIIDEVHMLSTGAFNALLKTLEEPPEHIIFILATTDPQKIPVTIHSRCQRFDFKRISAKLIGETLKKYMEEEQIKVTEDAISYIAAAADGAMRDALSVIDQCAAFYFGEEITLSKVLEVCGAVDTEVLFEMTQALFEHNGRKCLKIIEDAVSKGRDIIQFVNDLIVHIRNVLVSASAEEGSYALEFSGENIEKYRKQAEKTDKGFLIELISVFSGLQPTLKYSAAPRVVFEVECLKICNPSDGENIEQLKSEMRSLRKMIEGGAFIREKALKDAEKEDIKIGSGPPKPAPAPASESIKAVVGQWINFTSDFKVADRSFLIKAKPKVLDDKLYIVCENKGSFERISRIKDEISEKLSEKYKNSFGLQVITKEDFDERCGRFDMTDVQTDFNIEEAVSAKLDGVLWD